MKTNITIRSTNNRTPRAKRGAKTQQSAQIATLCAICVAATAFAENAPRLALRSQVHAYDAKLHLSDVLYVRNADDALNNILAQTTIELPTSAANTHTVTYSQISNLLEKNRVNLGDILLSGARECKITITRTEAEPAPITESKQESSKGRNTPQIKTVSDTNDELPAGETSLANVLTQRVQREYSRSSTKVALDFEQAGAEFLRLTTPPFDFTIRGGRKSNSGLREFRVTVSRDGTQQRTVQIFARVRVEVPVIIAVNPLNIGTYLRRDDFRVEKRTYAENAQSEQISPDALVGQRLKRFIDRGEVVSAKDLKPEPLVRRSRPVTVHNETAGVSMRLTGIALDNGMLGDTVRVRIGPSHGKRREVRGVVKGVSTVAVAGG